MGFLLILSPAGGLWNTKGDGKGAPPLDFERPPSAAEEGSATSSGGVCRSFFHWALAGQALALAQAKRSGKA